MSELVRESKIISDRYWLIGMKQDTDYVMTLFKSHIDLLEKQERLLGLYRRFVKGLLEHDVYLEDVMHDIKQEETL